MRAKNYFQINGFALSFALKQSLSATQKWFIPVLPFYRAGILYLCPWLVPRPHYSARPMRFRSRGPSEEVSFLPVFLGYVTEVN